MRVFLILALIGSSARAESPFPPKAVYNPSGGCKNIGSKLALLARQVAKTSAIEVGFFNGGTTSVCMQAPAATCAGSYAHVGITLLDAVSTKPHVLYLPPSSCDKTSRAAMIELPPGATVWERIDLATWVAPGTFARSQRVEVTYAVVIPKGATPPIWQGTLSTRVTVAP